MLKRAIINFAKKHHATMRLLRALRNGKNKIAYIFLMCTNNIHPELVIFESFMGRQYSDSPKAIYEYLLSNEDYKGLKFVWAAKDPNNFDMPKNRRTKVVKYNSREYRRVYAKAKFWVSNSRIPEYIIRKPRQVYIQTWHGTPLKKLGYDIKVEGGNAMNTVADIRKKYRTDSKRYSYLISPSDFCTEHFTSIFHLEKRKNIIKTLGSPRCDYLVNYPKSDVAKIKKKLNLPKNKKIILYAPTWRDNQHQSGLGYTYDNQLDFKTLKKSFGDEYIILFRAHYFVANQFDFAEYKDFVYDVSPYPDIAELYVISDMLITDYSSAMFDYAILKRPMIFFMYDLDEYKGKLRDFYFDLKELPGPIAENSNKLTSILKDFDSEKYWKKYSEDYQQFNNKFNHLADGSVIRRTVALAFSKCAEQTRNKRMIACRD